MAIDAYVGLPGHGKSYGVVEHVIVPSLKEGRHVVTNIPLKYHRLMADFGEDSGAQISQLPLDWHKAPDLGELAPPGSVLVLDEVWRRWPAGEVVSSASFEDKELLAEHRHRVDEKDRSMRVVLVTQDLAQISSWVRLLVESTYRISKKSKKFYVVSIFNGAVTGTRPPKTALLRQTSGTFKKDIYQYYSSATHSKTGNVGDESTADGRANILKSLGLWASLSTVLILGVLGVWGVMSFFSTPSVVEREPVLPSFSPSIPEPEPLAIPAPVAEPVAQEVEVIQELPLSVLWRVAGFVTGEGQGTSRVALRSHTSGMRFVPLSDCQFYPSGIDVFCDIEGERITPWSGGGAVSTVYQTDPSG